MATVKYDFEDMNLDINYRWLQPPQIAYFVTTRDKRGNVNATPVTLGTLVAASLPRNGKPAEFFFTFALGSTDLHDPGNEIESRHAFHNLEETGECVISYIGAELAFASTVAGLPVPRSISEIDVAGLTELPSLKVGPPGISECPVNMEAVIRSSQPLGSYYRLYLAEIVAAQIDEKFVKEDDGIGVLAIDPLFEALIDRSDEPDGNIRLSYARIDSDSLTRMGVGLGCREDWIGTFPKWIEGEVARGKISREEGESILETGRLWKANPDPIGNSLIKKQLTEMLRRLCTRKEEGTSHGKTG